MFAKYFFSLIIKNYTTFTKWFVYNNSDLLKLESSMMK